MTAASYLSHRQVEQLLRPIATGRVSRRDGQAHLEAYDVRAHLNRVFGFGRWDGEALEGDLLFEEVYGEKVQNGTRWDDQRRVSVGYRVRYQLTVRAPDGTQLARYTEVATGDATNFPGSKRADAHDFAVKTAESQALKRCAINLGDQFGLSLYRNNSTDAVVTGTLVGLPEPETKPDTDTAVDAAAPDVVPEQEPEHHHSPEAPPSGATSTPPDGEHDLSAQALADLAHVVTTVQNLKAQVYDTAKRTQLLGVTVRDPKTGQAARLTDVITDRRAKLAAASEENPA